MPRIEIHNLQTLAERPAGKTHLGELIRRLIYATVAKQQRELAKRWHRNAQTIGSGWPRAQALCLRIAESWIQHAEAEDLDAQRDRARRSR